MWHKKSEKLNNKSPVLKKTKLLSIILVSLKQSWQSIEHNYWSRPQKEVKEKVLRSVASETHVFVWLVFHQSESPLCSLALLILLHFQLLTSLLLWLAFLVSFTTTMLRFNYLIYLVLLKEQLKERVEEDRSSLLQRIQTWFWWCCRRQKLNNTR